MSYGPAAILDLIKTGIPVRFSDPENPRGLPYKPNISDYLTQFDIYIYIHTYSFITQNDRTYLHIECLRRLNQQGRVGHFGLKFYGVPFKIDSYDVGVCRERTPQLTNRDITFEQFHRM